MDSALERPESLRRMYAALWTFAAGRRLLLACGLGLLFASQLVMLAVPWLAAQAIDAIQGKGSAGLIEAGRWLALVVAATAANWALHGPGRLLERNVALAVREKLSDQLMRRLFAAPLAWHQGHHSGETLHRLQNSTGALYDFAQSQFIYLQNTVRLVGPVIALWLISPLVGALALLGYGLLAGIILGFDRRMMAIAVLENHADRRYSAALVDALGNVFSITALRRGAGVAALVAERLRASFEPLRRAILLNELKWASVDLLTTLLWCLLVALYAWLAGGEATTAGALAGGVALGKVFMVYEYSRQAGGVITALAAHFQSLARQQANYAAVQPIMAAPQLAVPPQALGGHWQSLQLAGLRHAYGDAQPPALRELDLNLRRGRRYALVGASGAGKTSLMRILAGLDEAGAGTILLDEQPIAAAADRLRREATLIPQQAEIFEGSIAENLMLGASPTADELQRALRASCIDGLIATQPQGIDSPIAEGGANWSGGQRQRLALARGLLAAAGSALVMLDEPTSSLDADTEARVLGGLFEFFEDATLIVSVHRLHLLERFDEVILMDGGRVIGCGSAAELLLDCAPFRALLQHSASSAERG